MSVMYSMYLILVSGFSGISCSQEGKRIWLGETVSPGDASFVVLIKAGSSVCSGVAIHDNFVLTAAHCFDSIRAQKRKSAVVYFGHIDADAMLNENYTDKIESVAVHEHPKYLPNYLGTGMHADIAMIELEDSILDDSENYVNIIRLDAKWPVRRSKPIRRHCIGYGYGASEHNDSLLRRNHFVGLHAYGECDCVKTVNTVCVEKTSRTSFCAGDSGGPLICDGKLVGISSFIYNAKSCSTPFTKSRNVKCGDTQTGSVMTFICPFLDWIGDIVDDAIIPEKPISCHGQISHHISYTEHLFIIILFHFIYCLLHKVFK